MAHQIFIQSTIPDTRAVVRRKKFLTIESHLKIDDVQITDVYTIDKEIEAAALAKIGGMLANPVVSTFDFRLPAATLVEAGPSTFDSFQWIIEIGFLPGVTDNVAHTVKESIEDLLKIKFAEGEGVYTSQITFISGTLTREQVQRIAGTLANPLIQRIRIKSFEEFKRAGGMDLVVPKVSLHERASIDQINLNLTDAELQQLGQQGIQNPDASRRGPLSLGLSELTVIKKYFDSQNRKPTDVELEMIAQTWSEHCKHTIFAAEIDDIKDGIYKHYIRRATENIRKQKGKKDFCVSVFKDNSGGIIFDDNWIVTHKVETHNSPSALDPFGGAITGIVGVNRDTVGFGKGAKPVANIYGFCFGAPDDTRPLYRDAQKTDQMLNPKRIMDGVIDGVREGGNCSGIPTPQGFVYFDDRYRGKPLVFVGTVGLIPKKINGKLSYEKCAQAGDCIVMVGGRVGKDGIHGATFSSEALTQGSPATAVQIGDPITQKKLSDAIIKEARDLDLYHSITDNGAGGLSSSIGEMAGESGGCVVDLDKIPLKYPGLAPWEIWISESQERMTLAVPPQNVDAFLALMSKRGVEATVIGEFTDSERCVVKYHGQTAVDLELEFLQSGLPKKNFLTRQTCPTSPTCLTGPTNPKDKLCSLLASPNSCSFSFITHQFDHEVQAGSVLKPLQGKGMVNAAASVIRPVFSSKKGVVLSQALCPQYSETNPYNMAACAIDSAIANIIAAGGSLDHLALLDNFCWCDSTNPERLWQLKEAARACYDTAVAFGTPFISGKDSMFNDFKGYDENGKPIAISIPPTLLISSVGVIDDVMKTVSLDAKCAGDLVYMLGETKTEEGVPAVDVEAAIILYRALTAAIAQELVASSIAVGLGGLGVALAKVAIGGQLGMAVDFAGIGVETSDRASLLFAETQSRFVVTINPAKKEKFETIMNGLPVFCVGVVRKDENFVIAANGKKIVETSVGELTREYRRRFGNM